MKKILNKKVTAVALSMLLLTSVSGSAFAANNNYALCVGDPHAGSAKSVASKASNYYVQAGRSSLFLSEPTSAQFNGTYNGIRILDFGVLFLNGHAAPQYITISDINDKNTIFGLTSSPNYNLTHINNINVNGTTLVTYAGCQTAGNGDNNISASTRNYGATTVVGWSDNLNMTSSPNWLNRYNEKLKDGNTVLQAIQYANSFSYLFSDVKTARYYGSGNTKITTNSRQAISSNSITPCLGNKQLVHFNNNDGEIDILVQAIKAQYPNFDKNEYEITIYHSGENNYTVDFIKTIGKFRTNSGYILTVTDGALSEIKPINENEASYVQYNRAAQLSTTNIDQRIIKSANLKANNEIVQLEKNRDISITQQENKYYYDVIENKAYILTSTVYTVDGQTYSEYGAIQEI